MDHQVKGCLHRALVLILLVAQWRPVWSAPVHTCDTEQAQNIAKLLQHETNKTLDEYITAHGITDDLIPDDDVNSAVAGTGVSEKLQDIYTKNQLFQLHIKQIENYGLNTGNVAAQLTHVKNQLGRNLAAMKNILNNLQIPVPPAPAPPKEKPDDIYARKVYGWSVLVALRGWLTEVLGVLKEAC